MTTKSKASKKTKAPAKAKAAATEATKKTSAKKSAVKKPAKKKTAAKKAAAKKPASPKPAPQLKAAAARPEIKPTVPVAKEAAPLINSPYQMFAPLLELMTTPWRQFMPFSPWPIQERGRKK